MGSGSEKSPATIARINDDGRHRLFWRVFRSHLHFQRWQIHSSDLTIDDREGKYMSYNGGKGQAGTYQKIINQMPPHKTYVEAFAGGASVLLWKRRAETNFAIDLDPEPLARLDVPHLHRLNCDALSFLKNTSLDSPALIYCDPPYVMASRKTQRPLYRYEFSDEQHVELLQIVRTIPAMVMVSGYFSELYAAALHDWRVVTFQAVTRGGTLATEYLWCNFPEPTELHDYSFLGNDFRERERIKRKTKRWQERIKKMPVLEQYALRTAIAR